MRRNVDLIVVHHSASALTTLVEDIRNWHVIGNHWRDIGYHGVIEQHGDWKPGRPFEEVGAHARGANKTSIGICVVGNNLVEGQEWTDPQINALLEAINFLSQQYSVTRVAGHREVGTTQTECPGVDVCELLGIQKEQ